MHRRKVPRRTLALQRRRQTSAWLLAALSTMAAAPTAQASGWVKDPGQAYVKASLGTFSSDDSEEGAGLQYVNQSAGIYAEVGVLEGLHVQMDTQYVWAANEANGGKIRYKHAGFGDLTVGVRYRLAAQPVALALGVDVKGPLYKDVNEVDGADELGERVSFPDLGDGEVDTSVGLGAGVSFHPLPIWSVAWLAYQKRGGDFVDTALASVTVGGSVAKVLGLSTGADAAYALSEDSVTKSWVSLRVQAWLELGSGLSPEAHFGFMPWTENTEAGMQFLLGVSWKR